MKDLFALTIFCIVYQIYLMLNKVLLKVQNQLFSPQNGNYDINLVSTEIIERLRTGKK